MFLGWTHICKSLVGRCLWCLIYATYERKLHKPRHEEGEKLFGSDVGACREGVVEVFPSTSKDAAQHHRQNIASVERLDAVPDDANDSSDEDEEVRSPHAHNGARNHRAGYCQVLIECF